MTPMLEVALACVARGWHVFPCKPKSKIPATRNGFKDATVDGAQVRAWWERSPDANVAIACGVSGLAVLDIDEGPVQSAEELRAWMDTAGLPPTYAVRTGRRVDKATGGPAFGAQLYYEGAIPDVGLWKLAGGSGQVKSLGGYVMAAGSIHPDSGEAYEVISSRTVAFTPEVVRQLKTGEREALKVVAGKKIPDGAGRHHAMTSVAGGLRAKGLDGDAIYEALVPINPAMCEVPISDDDLKAIAYGVARRYPAGEIEPEVLIGGKIAEPSKPAEPPKDWRSFYHSFDEMENAPEMSFLIDNFLHAESITGLAAAVGQRKSLIALNVAHALCTGEPFLGKFEVIEKPKKVLYLCPEMGMRSFRKRVRAIGLMPYVGKTLFIRTMNKDDHRSLADLTPDELDGSVVILDTAVRFIEGDENSAQDMKLFAGAAFRLMPRDGEPGAAALLILYHSGKGGKETTELTMENVLRGSGELGAALTCCWATRLQDPGEKFKSVSFISCVKPRDFDKEPEPFEASCDASCRMAFVESEGKVVLQTKPRGVTADRDGRDAAAFGVIRANMELSGVKVSALLKEHGITRSPDWCNRKKKEMSGGTGGVKLNGK